MLSVPYDFLFKIAVVLFHSIYSIPFQRNGIKKGFSGKTGKFWIKAVL